MLNNACRMEITIITFDPCRHVKTGGGRLNTVSANHMRFEVCTCFLCWQQKLKFGIQCSLREKCPRLQGHQQVHAPRTWWLCCGWVLSKHSQQHLYGSNGIILLRPEVVWPWHIIIFMFRWQQAQPNHMWVMAAGSTFSELFTCNDEQRSVPPCSCNHNMTEC